MNRPHPAFGHLLPGRRECKDGTMKSVKVQMSLLLPPGEGGRRPDEGRRLTTRPSSQFVFITLQ